MPRPRATIEYLRILIQWAGNRNEFCRLTGIRKPNLSAYLAGTKNVSWKLLRSATSHVFGEPPAFLPILEGYDYRRHGRPSLDELPKSPGFYALYDSAMRIIYFGKTSDSLYNEVGQTLGRKIGEVRPWSGKKNLKFSDITTYISAYALARVDAQFIHDLEVFVLQLLVNNTFNKKSGTFRRSA